jgi:hypothetical protein
LPPSGPPPPAPPPAAPPYQPPSGPARSRKGPIIGGGLGLVALIVVIILIATQTGGDGGGGGQQSTPAGGGASPSQSASAEPLALTGVRADAGKWKADPSSWSVTLTWDAPAGEVDHYEVRRNGKKLDTSLTTTKFEDGDVEPETTYRYDVIAVDPSGAPSEPATARVKTGRLATEDGRLEGQYIVKLHVVSSSLGFKGGSIVFVLNADCREGPCDIRWSLKGRPGEGELKRSGASYEGHASTPLFIRSCHGSTIPESVDVKIRVTTSHFVRHAWRATKFEGTINEYASSSGCVSAHNTFSLSGTLR